MLRSRVSHILNKKKRKSFKKKQESALRYEVQEITHVDPPMDLAGLKNIIHNHWSNNVHVTRQRSILTYLPCRCGWRGPNNKSLRTYSV